MLLVFAINLEMCTGHFIFNKVGKEIDIGLIFKYIVGILYFI